MTFVPMHMRRFQRSPQSNRPLIIAGGDGVPVADANGARIIAELGDDPQFPAPPYPQFWGRKRDLDADPRRGDTRWGRLAKDQALGKAVVMRYWKPTEIPRGDNPSRIAPVPFFDFGGSNLDAEQLQIVIDKPRVIPIANADLTSDDLQYLSGQYDNFTWPGGDFPGTAGPLAWPPFSVLIEWGTNARTSVIVDALNGAKVNISASWCRAIALTTIDADNQPGTSGAYVLSAFASPGWTSDGNARRTMYLGEVLSGDSSAVFATPPFAKRATVNACDPTGAAITVATLQFWQADTGADNVGNFLVTGNQPGPFDVPNAGAYFSVLNGTGSDLKFNVVFELAVS